jgi:hypothetical protein
MRDPRALKNVAEYGCVLEPMKTGGGNHIVFVVFKGPKGPPPSHAIKFACSPRAGP